MNRVPDVVEILVTAKNLAGPAFAKAKADATDMEASMSRLNKTSGLAAAAMVGFAGAAIGMAAKFDSQMQLLTTQAGVSQDQIAGLSKGVLDLSGQVGFSPDSLAEALFHVESNMASMGATSQQALGALKVAAQGAAVGHANLVDVTNALTAAVTSGIPGVQNMQQAMGVLNATVGAGDMQMKDLAKAFGSGMLATVKGFGLSIADVGAALATFGDNNIRGAAAATNLRVSVQALAQPVASGKNALKELGLTTTTLAEDMQKGGLKLALEDLSARMTKAGITADQQSEVITQAFGRKAGTGISILLSQMDRLESKYPALEQGANGFADAWAKTQQTFSFQMKQLQSSADALMISLGEKLIPYVQALVKVLLDHKAVVVDVAKATGILVAALAGFSVLSKITDLVKNVSTAFSATSEAMAAWKTRMFDVMLADAQAEGSLTTLGAAFSTLGTSAKIATAGTVIGLIVTGLVMLTDALKPAPPNVDKLTLSLEALGDKGRPAGEMVKAFGENLDGLGVAVDRIAGKLDQTVESYNRFGNATGKSSAFGMSADEAKGKIDALDQSLADMVSGGHADLAAAALKRMQQALVAQGKNPADLANDLHKYDDALAGAAMQQQLTADSMGALGQQAVDTSNKLGAQTLTAQGLKEAIIDLNDANRSALDGMAGFYAAVDAATKSVKDDGSALHMTNGELDLTNEKARNNERALSDLAAKTDAAAQAALNNGESMAKANQIYADGRQKLIDLAGQMGLSAQDAKDLADSILQIPPVTDISVNTVVTTTYRDVHTGVVTQVGTGGDLYQHGMAHGGIIGAQGGGPRSGLTLVGEHGPELVSLPFGSTVHSNSDSRRMASAMAGGGGNPGVVQLEWVGGNAGDQFMVWLRNNIRVRGGNVQTVLGQS